MKRAWLYLVALTTAATPLVAIKWQARFEGSNGVAWNQQLNRNGDLGDSARVTVSHPDSAIWYEGWIYKRRPIRPDTIVPPPIDTLPTPPDTVPLPPVDTTPLPPPADQPQRIVIENGDGQTAPAGSVLKVLISVRDSLGAKMGGIALTWTASPGSVVGNAQTGPLGNADAQWRLGPAGPQTLTVTSAGGGTATFSATATDTVTSPPPPPPPPPPTGGTSLTPADMRLALGPLVSRGTQVAGWPAGYDAKLDAAITRMVSEVASGSYSYITDSGDPDNPHYGPFRMVVMRNIRAGLPLNETEPGFAAGLRITREFIRQYAITNGNRLTLYRNTNLIDAELVYWIYRTDSGDNGILARQAREYLQVTSAWLSNNLTPAQENLDHHWMDTRTIALAIEAALAAQRVGWAFGATGAASYNPHAQTQYKPAGVNSWESWIAYVNGFIDRMQAKSQARFGAMTDPNGFPILAGNIRYGQSGDWACSNMPCTAYREPYPFKPFMDGMTANALLRAWRQQGSTASRDNAIEMAVGIQQHYSTARRTLPYSSHGTSAARYFYNDATDYVLNNFWARPLIEMWTLTGQQWMYDAGTGLLAQSLSADWVWRFKMSQQLGSATEPQSAQAWLAGVH